MLARIRGWAQRLKAHALTVYFAARDPRMPWAPRWLALAVAAYAFSPIDLIPDFIPVLGLLDDLLLVPLGVALVVRLTPRAVLEAARARAATAARPVGRIAAVLVIAAWFAATALVLAWATGRAGTA